MPLLSRASYTICGGRCHLRGIFTTFWIFLCETLCWYVLSSGVVPETGEMVFLKGPERSKEKETQEEDAEQLKKSRLQLAGGSLKFEPTSRSRFRFIHCAGH